MLDKEINQLLKSREFISIATCDLADQPNAAPKFFLKLEDGHIYLVDYSIGRTWRNLQVNPRASLSLMDTEKLVGYQVNGTVEIIDKGGEFEKIMHELVEREVTLSAKRIIEGVTSGKKHTNFELDISKKFAILKIKVEEVAQIGARGEIKREKLC